MIMNMFGLYGKNFQRKKGLFANHIQVQSIAISKINSEQHFGLILLGPTK